jgi:hypothetical protein
MSYRPTIRYPYIYKDYVEAVYQATSLDRNQIIRLALFVAAHSTEYKVILQKHKLPDVPLPHPEWKRDEHKAWQDQSYIRKKQDPQPIKIIDQGGITIKLG